jgi:hypothetical protein
MMKSTKHTPSKTVTVAVHGITVTTEAPRFKSTLLEAAQLLKRIGATS